MTLVVPSDGLIHHEDLVVGSVGPFGQREVTRAEIIAFASAFDPQPIHLDDAAAKASIVGGLCASGFHTCAILMRLLCDQFLLKAASLGSPGIDDVRWLKPLRPGDRVSLRIDVLEMRNLNSRPDVGLAKMLFVLIDQAGGEVVTMLTNQLLRRRYPGSPVAKPLSSAERTSQALAGPPSVWDAPAETAVSAGGNYFEDQRIGEVRAIGSHTFNADDIITFARQFDPQPFHLDVEAGKRSLFGGLAASGWHTAAIFIRYVVRARQVHEAAIAAAGATLASWGPSPGFRNLGWPRPVLAGDTISFRNTVVELRELRSRPDRGLVISQAEGRNQRGETVFRFTGQMFVERRHAGVKA